MQVENLRAYLANINMTIKEFSILIDCNDKYLSNIIHGRRMPSRRLAKDIREITSGVINLKTNPKKYKRDVQQQNCPA